MTLYQLELDPVLQLADEQIIGPMPDRVIEFIVPNSEAAKAIDKEYWVKKERSREAEVRVSDVVRAVHTAGLRSGGVPKAA
jgi:hypothetical protein